MKVAIKDFNVLKQIKPSDASIYLAAKGWHLAREIPERVSIWRLEYQGEELEIILPLNQEFDDFANRIADIITTLEIVEVRPQLTILENLQNVFADIVNLRLSHNDFKDGTIPLLNGIEFHRHAKDMVLSAACSQIESRAFFVKKPEKAKKYLKKLKLGQPKLGSYILTIISPVTASEAQGSFARQTISKLESSLEFTRSYISHIRESKENIVITDEILSNGVSANLCEALNGIHKSGKSHGVEVCFNWSPAITQSTEQIQVTFPPEVMPLVSSLGLHLKAHSYRGIEIRGDVIRLNRSRLENTGKVTILGVIGDDEIERRITIELDEEEYGKAATANRTRGFVKVRGDLKQKGNSFTFTKLDSFEVL